MRAKDFSKAKRAFREMHPNLAKRIVYSAPVEEDTVLFYIDDGSLMVYDLAYCRTFVLNQRWKP